MTITLLFLAITSFFVFYQKRKEGNWVNLISILMAPYIPLVLLNNFVIYKTGFDKISDEVLLMVFCAFILFFIGSIPFKVNAKKNSEESCNEKLKRYNFSRMWWFLFIIGVIGTLKAIFMFLTGAFSSNIDDSEGEMGGGIVGHLLLASYSVLPIYFLYWTTRKRIITLIPIFLIIIVTFSSFVKYNIIGVFVSVFIFLSIYKKALLKKAVIILFVAVAVIFYANYAISFAVVGADVDPTFYIGHFWMYLSGSLIYDNYIFTSGIRPGISIGYKLMTFICALPNMFYEKIYDEKLFPHVRQDDLSIGIFGESSNVVDAIGYIYPSKGDVTDVLLFGIVVFIIGIICSAIYYWRMRPSKYFDMFIVNFLTYFVFFSFFGTFYINPGPWEILIYSLLIPQLFYKHGQKA